MALLELSDLLAAPPVECRREERRTMHAKGVVVPEVQTLVGSANLSLLGFRVNRELASVTHPRAVPLIGQLIGAWWEEAEPYDLAAAIQRRFVPYRPELVYLAMLSQVFGRQVDHRSAMDLRPWQRDAVAKALDIVDRHEGALLADDVGVGKTDEAIAIALHGTHVGWGRTLVVCPANLRGMWIDELRKHLVPCDVISYDKLLQDVRSAEENETGWREYGLLICDEAHHLRNPERFRNSALRQVIAHQPCPPKTVLITATPVNNAGLDLYELLCLADRSLEPHWVATRATTARRRKGRSPAAFRLYTVCRRPTAHSPAGPTMQGFYQALDDRIVRRSRSLIQRLYPESTSHFPQRIHRRVLYRLALRHRELVGDVLDGLGAGDLADAAGQLRQLRGDNPRTPPLTLAAYRAEEYRLVRAQGFVPISAFIKCLLLKRLESSPAAFASTATHMRDNYAFALRCLDRGWVLTPGPRRRRRLVHAIKTGMLDDRMAGSTDTDTDARLDQLVKAIENSDSDERRPAAEYDVARLRADLEHDRRIFAQLASLARQAVSQDTKFAELRALLCTLTETFPGHKILILTLSRQTAVDLHAKLQHAVDNEPRLAVLKGRIATAAPLPPLEKSALLATIAQFVPRTAARPASGVRAAHPPDRYDLLIGTDQLSEGHNLQQASILINYDLPWNPQALGQRIGRLDRYDAERPTVHCYTVLPDTALDVVLHLMAILQNKIDAAAATVGVPSALLPDSNETPRDFGTALDDLDREPHAVPVSPFERARAILGNALRAADVRSAVEALPVGAGGVHPRRPVTPEAVFCFEVAVDEGIEIALCYLRQGAQHARSTDTLECLRAAEVVVDRWLSEQPLPVLDPAPDPHAFHTLLWALIDTARKEVADRYRIPERETVDRVRLLTWLGFLNEANEKSAS
ncbi:SNF2-related protein [Amycolatopsis halotolerans]